MTVIKKRKCKSNTPIVFAVSKESQDKIKRIPWMSLNAFKENRATSTDWYNLAFRLKIGLLIAQEIYTEEAILPMKEIVDACLVMKDRYISEVIWDITDEEIDLIEIGLEATDTMTDETTRRIQLDAFHASDKFMKNILNSNSEKFTKGK